MTSLLICSVFVVLLTLVLVVGIVRPWAKLVGNFADEPDLTVSHSVVVHVNMTTIPERFASDWFAANMRRMMTTMRGNFVWWCNVPPSFGSTGQLYVVTPKVKQLLADFPNFRLFHTAQDWGPITKVLGGLYNPDIKLTDAMLICDDDVQYLPDFVQIAAAHFAKDATRVYTYCGSGVLGFRGYLVQKMLCLALPSNMPASCKRIDDDLLDMYFRGRTTAITYHGSKQAFCTIDANDWGDWHTEQHIALSNDNRPPMVTACRSDYYRNHQDGLHSTFLVLESGYIHHQTCVVDLQTYYPPPAQLSFSGLAAPSELGKIPKVIWRTAKDDNWQVTCRSAYDKTIETNPDWQQHVVTNTGLLAYIRRAYSSVQPIVDIAERIQLGVMLADLWRLLIIFDQGGLYLDLKCPVVKPIDAEMCVTNNAYVCQWKQQHPPQSHLFKRGEFVNWVIMAPPRNPAVWAAVCQVVANLQACQTHEDHRFMMLAEHNKQTSIMKSRVLCTTGPIAFTHAVLTRPNDIQIVAGELNGLVSYMPPKSSELLSARPDHYSKYTRRFLKAVQPATNCVPCILHMSSSSRNSVDQAVWQSIAKFVPSNFKVCFYSDDECATYMANLDKLGKTGTMYAALSAANKKHAFKCAVLHEYGGIWLDANGVLLKRLDSFVDLTVELTAVVSEQSPTIGLGILACAPRMAIMTQLLAKSLQTPSHKQTWHCEMMDSICEPEFELVEGNVRYFANQLEAQLSARYSGNAKPNLVAGRNQGVRFDFDLLTLKAANKQRHDMIFRNDQCVIRTLQDLT